MTKTHYSWLIKVLFCSGVVEKCYGLVPWCFGEIEGRGFTAMLQTIFFYKIFDVPSQV